MGRPIKKKFFGSLNTPYQNHPTGGRTGVGGEAVASTVVVGSSGTNYSTGATLVFSAPNIAGGIRATGTPVLAFVYGGITGVTVANPGTGYTSTATVSVTTASGVAVAGTGTISQNTVYLTTSNIYIGMKIIGSGINAGATYVTAIGEGRVTVSAANAGAVSGSIQLLDVGTGLTVTTALSTTTQNAITFTSYLTTGSSQITGGDILKQESSRRYLVQNTQGQGQCILTATSLLIPGTMNILATDWNGSTYYVKKLTARKAVVVQSTVSTAFLVGNGVSTGWTLNGATGTVVSIAHTI